MYVQVSVYSGVKVCTLAYVCAGCMWRILVPTGKRREGQRDIGGWLVWLVLQQRAAAVVATEHRGLLHRYDITEH